MKKKLMSRKLIMTVAVILLVAASEFLGLDLSDESLGTVTAVVLTWLGAQGLVDTAAAFRAGRALGDAAEDARDAVKGGSDG